MKRRAEGGNGKAKTSKSVGLKRARKETTEEKNAKLEREIDDIFAQHDVDHDKRDSSDEEDSGHREREVPDSSESSDQEDEEKDNRSGRNANVGSMGKEAKVETRVKPSSSSSDESGEESEVDSSEEKSKDDIREKENESEAEAEAEESGSSESDGEEKVGSLNDLDAKIAALEASLANNSESDGSSGDDSEGEDGEDGDTIKTGHNSREEFSEGTPAIICDDEGLERIPSLPSHLLPALGISKKLGSKPATDGTSEEKAVKEQKRTCDACNFTCQNSEAWSKHVRSLLHRQNVVLAAGAAFEPAQGRSNYCRVCQIQFESVEDLFEHRSTEEHKEKFRLERKASFCQVCKKQFTSASQLHEHVKGKVHKDTLESLKQKWGTGRGGKEGSNNKFNNNRGGRSSNSEIRQGGWKKDTAQDSSTFNKPPRSSPPRGRGRGGRRS